MVGEREDATGDENENYEGVKRKREDFERCRGKMKEVCVAER